MLCVKNNVRKRISLHANSEVCLIEMLSILPVMHSLNHCSFSTHDRRPGGRGEFAPDHSKNGRSNREESEREDERSLTRLGFEYAGIAGIGYNDFRKLSLRRLEWMVEGKKRHDYDVAIALVGYANDALAGRFDPKLANPYRDIEEFDRIKPKKAKENESKEGWMLFKRALGQMAKDMKQKNKRKKKE